MNYKITILLLLVLSCSRNPTNNSNNDIVNQMGVNPFEASLSDNKVDIRSNNYSGVGPTPLSSKNKNTENKRSKEPIIGFFIDAGGYKAMASLGLIDALKREGVKPYVFSGIGFGALISYFLANDKSSSEIEWLAYKFFRKAKKKEIYSQEWIKEIEDIFFDKLNIKLEKTQKTLILPLVNKDNKREKLFASGNASEKIIASLNILGTKGQYESLIENSPISPKFMHNYGVDIVIWVRPQSGMLKLEQTYGYQFGILSRYFSKLSRLELENEYIIDINMPDSTIAIDSSKMIQSYIQRANSSTIDHVKKVMSVIKKWKEINN